MKKVLNHRLYLPLFIMIVALLSACKKNVETPPVISEVRSYVASPNDTVLNSLVADGQWVVITGQNLKNAIQIKFDGVAAPFNGALFAQNSAVVQIPNILFSTIDTTKLYTLDYTTTGGTTTFAFKLGPGAPTITAISNVFANPGDSVFLYGANLVLVQSFSYAGTPITSFKPNLDGTSLGFKMPAQQPTDRILLTTKGGSIDYQIVATPTITSISNENAAAGDSVYVYGTYLRNIQSFTFAGEPITSYELSADNSSVGFVMPSISTSGPVSITTQFGTATSVYNVNDITTGMIANFEWSGPFGWQWWGGSNLTVADPSISGGWIPVDPAMNGNTGMFQVLKSPDPMDPGAGADWSTAIRTSGGQWIPAANLSDNPANWALKFEMKVPANWNGPTLAIKSDVAGALYRYEPWNAASGPVPFTTKGWITVTIPLSSFRTKSATLGDGKGAPITDLMTLVGPTGSTGLYLYMYNFGSSGTVTGYYAGFDNIRVVKIK